MPVVQHTRLPTVTTKAREYSEKQFVICRKLEPEWVLLTDGALMSEKAVVREQKKWAGFKPRLFPSRRAARSFMAERGKHPALYTVREFLAAPSGEPRT